MALFEEEQITDTLQTTAPSIKYEGNEGPQDPRQEQMLAQLKEEYMQYVFSQNELGEPVMSFQEWYQMVYEASKMGVQAPQEEMSMQETMMREPAAYGGIMDTESGRRAYGLGSIFKKITSPIKKVGSKLVGGVKKIAKSPLGKAALLYAGTAGLGALAGGAAGTGFTKAALTPSGIMSNFGKKKFLSDIGTKLTKGSTIKNLAKLGIGAASALPLLGIGTTAKQDQIENFSQSGDWDENFKTAGGFPGMRRAIARAKDQAELESLADQFGFTPGLFPQVAADGGRIGYKEGSMVEKIKERILEGGRRGVGAPLAPFIKEAIWIEKIKDFIRKRRGDPREEITEEIEGLYEGLRPRDPIHPMPMPMPDMPRRPMDPDFRRPIEDFKPLPDMPRRPRREREGYALGSKADFAIEDVMTGGVEDEIGGITGIMRQADLQRKGNIGQFYAANGGVADMREALKNKGYDWLDNADDKTVKQIFNSEVGTWTASDVWRPGKKEGGIMDLGGMEKDYRNTGGFVDLGAEEKADDVPARLSVNEFVMTADAVRGAGDGDIDKGAERMEDMMKTLEQKGQQENMKMAGPDWYIKRIEHLMFLGYDYDEAAEIAFDSNRYYEIVGDPMARNKGASDMFEVSERLSEVV